MSTKSPIFPMPEPHHFSDYGFDPQIDYFQVPHLSSSLFPLFFYFFGLSHFTLSLFIAGTGRSEKAQERNSIHRRYPFQAAETQLQGRSEEAEVVEKCAPVLEMEVGGGGAAAPPLSSEASWGCFRAGVRRGAGDRKPKQAEFRAAGGDDESAWERGG